MVGSLEEGSFEVATIDQTEDIHDAFEVWVHFGTLGFF